MGTILEQIATFISSTKYEDLPESVIALGIMGLTDYCACAIAGVASPVSKNILSYLKENTVVKGPCSFFGTKIRSDLKNAALYNGVSSHCMDFDDVSWTTIGHPSVSTAPAVFACAQAGKWDGKETLLAYILAIEAMHQIAALTMPEVSERGWHTTMAYGVFGSVVPAARLYNLKEEQIVNALAIVASRSGGIRANFGTQTKALHAGLANRIGIDSAQMSSSGITASPFAIEGPDGFAQCFAGCSPKGEISLGKEWDLEKRGLVIKKYPCCSGSHPANDIWDNFLNKRHIKADDIESIEAGVSLLGPKELTCHLPQDAVQAKFSMEFALAYRLLKGPLSLSAFNSDDVQSPEIQTFMKKIKMVVSPELAKLGFIGTAPVRLRVRLKNGEQVLLSNDLAEGNPEKPLSQEMIYRKFMDCASGLHDDRTADKWFLILQNLPLATPEEIFSLGLVS